MHRQRTKISLDETKVPTVIKLSKQAWCMFYHGAVLMLNLLRVFCCKANSLNKVIFIFTKVPVGCNTYVLLSSTNKKKVGRDRVLSAHSLFFLNLLTDSLL